MDIAHHIFLVSEIFLSMYYYRRVIVLNIITPPGIRIDDINTWQHNTELDGLNTHILESRENFIYSCNVNYEV